ncbi:MULTISPECIES: hypothetical protein [Commensalibacter]|uniref:hypothetical protein n=1 Tax=Commensalibacter TaxID=1079922 RepID=UPI0012D97959|nr:MULTISPECIES: hypothetical protein [Commensalibacter]MBI0089096.1 hypothetical protein [Commensalibacter melissae]MUG35351.1 hypothetical protein [Commensalibacter sp. ESL0382]MUH07267.1 hypothetical protein [Commensalibacter melissae]
MKPSLNRSPLSLHYLRKGYVGGIPEQGIRIHFRKTQNASLCLRPAFPDPAEKVFLVSIDIIKTRQVITHPISTTILERR